MNRLTINISPERHKALKATAARRGTTIGQLVDESLDAYGIKPEGSIKELLTRARAHSRLATGAAEALAVEETRKARR